ncbi:MAG: hypothetical protein ACFCUU_18025 [Cyclobacteriaceae bacterium]
MYKRLANIITPFFILLFAFANLYAQEQEIEQQPTNRDNTRQGPSFWQKASFGGNFGFMSSRNFTYLEVSPLIAYPLNERLSVGGGAIYIYTKEFNPFANSLATRNITSHTYGGRAFTRADVMGPVFAYGEFEMVNSRFSTFDNQTVERGWVPGLHLGGGIMQPLGRRGGVGIMLLYNVLHDDRRSYANNAFSYRVMFFL